jgi:polysaccharide pyruvyl transferase WcaK-like protein
MKISLIGTFDVDNYGDCLFPELYIHEIKKRIHDVEFTLFSPTDKKAQILSFDEINALPKTLEFSNALENDASLLIGGETITLGHSMGTYIFPLNTLSASLRLWMPALFHCVQTQQPFMTHSVGINAIPEQHLTDVLKLLGLANHISVRDEFSSQKLTKAGIKSTIDVDPVFCLRNLLSANEWKRRAQSTLPEGFGEENYLIAQISAPYLKQNVKFWANKMSQIANKNNLKIVLLPICHFLHDRIILQSAKKHIEESGVDVCLIGNRINVKDTAAVFSQAYGYCGSSLHGAVSSVAFGKKVSVLGHTETGKHSGVMRAISLPDVTTTDIGQLDTCLDNSKKYDMHSILSDAIDEAEKGLDQLAERLGKPVHRELNINEAAPEFQHLINCDRYTITSFSQKIKRAIFTFLKNGKFTHNLYFYLNNKIKNKI